MEAEHSKKFDKEFSKDWKPLLMSNGKWDEEKIKNELADLVFIYEQVGEVYCTITGGVLSKPMYFSKIIIDFYEDELQKEYDRGCTDRGVN